MNLYINPLLPDITITLLEWTKIEKTFSIPKGDDFESFPNIIMEIIQNHEIEEIWTLLWPGLFTRMRIVTLTLGSIIFSKKIHIKWIHFFDLISHEIPIIQANTDEYRVLIKNTDMIVHKNELPDWNYQGYGDKNNFTDGKVFIEYKENWWEISTIFQNLPLLKEVSPIYIKSPHITWSKKNMFPSSKKMKK